MRRLAATVRTVPLIHDDECSVPSFPSHAPHASVSSCDTRETHSPWVAFTKHFSRQSVYCDGGSSSSKYSRQQSIQFMVSRENIIRRPANSNANFRSAYKIEGELGTGAFGRVWKVRHRSSGQIRAAKEIKKSDLGRDKWNIFEAEVEFLTQLDHPNVVRLIEFFKEEDDKSQDASMFLILELCNGPDLFDHMSDVFSKQARFTDAEAAVILRGMLRAILCCHCNNIAHRDIKPENFMFPTRNPSDPIKMIDLGLSEKFTEGKSLCGAIGTVGYMAPEVVKGRYSRECDMWSLGVIFYVMLTGRPLLPFDAPQREVDRLVSGGRYVEDQIKTHCSHVSSDARQLLVEMLERDPKKRITAQQALQHPFLRTVYESDEPNYTGLLQLRRVSTAYDANYTKVANMLEHYARQPMLKRAILLLLAHMIEVDDPSMRSSQLTFREFDADGNGELTTVEINDAFQSKGVKLPPNWANIITRVDINNSGTVNFVEWVAATLPSTVYLQESNLRAAFQFLDTRNVGTVTADDIVILFPSLKNASLESQQKVLVNAVGKTSFTFDDFKKMMSKDAI